VATRGDRDVRAGFGEETGCTQPHGPGAGGHEHLPVTHVAHGARDFHDGGDGGRIRSVRVQHHRDAERTEDGLLRCREDLLTYGHVAAADEHRGVGEIFRSAREDAPVNQIAYIVLGHSAALHDGIRAAVVCDDFVERAGESIRIELKQEFFHPGHPWMNTGRREAPRVVVSIPASPWTAYAAMRVRGPTLQLSFGAARERVTGRLLAGDD